MYRPSFLSLLTLTLCLNGIVSASDSTLVVNISITMAQVNEIEWSTGTAQSDKDGNRSWTLTNCALNTAYISDTDGTMKEASTTTITGTDVLDIKNRSTTPVSLAIQAVSTTWAIAANTGADAYKLEFSNNGQSSWTALAENSAATLKDPVAGSATQTFDLRLTTPLTVTSGTTPATCAVTITSTLK